jgi:hypothetical protein
MFFLFLISVAELFLPTTWMFLGLAYWQLARKNQAKTEATSSLRARKLLSGRCASA